MNTIQLAGAVEYTNCISSEEYSLNECPGYNFKPSDSRAPTLEIWGMWSTCLLPLLPGPL